LIMWLLIIDYLLYIHVQTQIFLKPYLTMLVDK